MLLRAPKCSNTTSSLNLVPSGILWFVVGMYLRFTSRANTDGSVVRYVALAHNRRVDGKIKPDVLMNLGRGDVVVGRVVATVGGGCGGTGDHRRPPVHHEHGTGARRQPGGGADEQAVGRRVGL